MQENRKRLGLILGGGGAKGACHVGVIKALVENDIPIDCISGCSMGAIVGGAYASGVKIDEIESIFRRFKQKKMMDITVRPISTAGFLKGNSAEKLLKKYLLTDDAATTAIPFNCVAVDICAGNLEILDSGSLSKNIRASFSVPSMFRPFKQGDKAYVDGGVLCRIPYGAMKRFSPDVTIAVDALGDFQPSNDYGSIFSVLYRIFEIMDWHITSNNNEKCDLLITPDNYESNAFHAKYVAPSIEAGYNATVSRMDEIKALLYGGDGARECPTA